MNHKFSFLLITFSLFSICFAPIRDPDAIKHALPIQSAAQVAVEQKFNGVRGVVGDVPKTTDPNQQHLEISSDEKAAKVVAAAKVVDPSERAVTNLDRGELRVDQAKVGGLNPLVLCLLVAGIVAALLCAAKLALDKFGPTPKKIASADY